MSQFSYHLAGILPKEICNYENSGGWLYFSHSFTKIEELPDWMMIGDPTVTTTKAGGRGVTVITPRFSGTAEDAGKLEAGLKVLEEKGATTNPTCNAILFQWVENVETIPKALGLFRKFEGAFYGMTGNPRYKNWGFSRPISPYKTPDGLWGGVYRSPYFWVSASVPGTLIFRFSGSLSPKKLLAWEQITRGVIMKAEILENLPWEDPQGTPMEQFEEICNLLDWNEGGLYLGGITGKDCGEAKAELKRLIAQYEEIEQGVA